MSGRPRPRVIVENLIPFAVTGILFGITYNALFYPHTLVEFAEASTIGLILGLITGTAELAILKNWLRQKSFAQALLARTVLYAGVVAISLSLVLSIEPATLGECGYFRCFIEYLKGPLFLRDLVFSTAIVLIIVFLAQVILLVGMKNFRRQFLGKYHQPRELYATFMFVDVRSSTTIAEQLGHKRFSSFLTDFFNDVSGPIQEAKGEIYQYVGDEVVIVWPGDQYKGQSNWLVCYEAMKAYLDKVAPVYLNSYGVAPEFKAGVHGGLVIASEVGSLQRAHVYHGDVLNTASRIQAKCNELGFDLLASELLVSEISSSRREEFKSVGGIPLRGKMEEVVIYGLQSTRKYDKTK